MSRARLAQPSGEEFSREDLIGVIEDLVNQYAYEGTYRGRPALTTGGLSALESAFDALGWTDPYPAPWRKCQVPRCRKWIEGGAPTPKGYKHMCGDHLRENEEGT